MSTQTAAEIQAEADNKAAEDYLASFKQFKKTNKVLLAKSKVIQKEEARIMAAQIVRPLAAPQNLIVTYQAPDPGTPAMAMTGYLSPGAELNLGMTPDDGLDIYQDDFDLAADAAQEAQLVMPHDLPINVAFNLNDQRTLAPEAIIQPVYLQGRRPAVITNEEYDKRSNLGLYPNKFLRREYNDNPYDPYLNKRMWIVAGVGYWKYEPNVGLHQEEIEHEAQQAKNLLEAKGPMSKVEKTLRKQMKEIRKIGGGARGAQGANNGLDQTQSSWLKPQKGQYYRAHLKRSDQMHEIDPRRVGSIEHAQSDEYNQSRAHFGMVAPSAFPAMRDLMVSPEVYQKQANDRAYQHWADLADRRSEFLAAGGQEDEPPRKRPTVADIIRQNNPQGIERAPAGSRADDFPDAARRGSTTVEGEDWDAPIAGLRPSPREEELTAREEELQYQSAKRKQARKRRRQQVIGSMPSGWNEKKDMLEALGLKY